MKLRGKTVENKNGHHGWWKTEEMILLTKITTTTHKKEHTSVSYATYSLVCFFAVLPPQLLIITYPQLKKRKKSFIRLKTVALTDRLVLSSHSCHFSPTIFKVSDWTKNFCIPFFSLLGSIIYFLFTYIFITFYNCIFRLIIYLSLFLFPSFYADKFSSFLLLLMLMLIPLLSVSLQFNSRQLNIIVWCHFFYY